MLTPRILKNPSVRSSWCSTGKTENGSSVRGCGASRTTSPVSQRRNGVIVFDHSGVMTSSPCSPGATGLPLAESTTSR